MKEPVQNGGVNKGHMLSDMVANPQNIYPLPSMLRDLIEVLWTLTALSRKCHIIQYMLMIEAVQNGSVNKGHTLLVTWL